MSGNWVHPGQILFWAIWVLVAPTKGPSAEGPQRNTRLGWIQGKQVTVLGKATSYPNLCLQNSEWLRLDQHMLKVHYPHIGASEDCLYLNIYAPVHADAGSKLPILVWFPRGAFKTDSASIFDGSTLAAYEDMLVVVVQHRLGIFGFFTTWDQHAPGNWAFKDQVAALSWVQKNIEFFGGDPSSVTIFGESAGAISVSSLILSPMAEGLFHKAIMESGVAIIPYLKAYDYEKSEDLQVVAHFCGKNASDSEDLLRFCERKLLMIFFSSLLQKTKPFTLVVDGAFFPNEPLGLLSQKAFKAIPSIIGVNNPECGFPLPMNEAPEILSGSKSLTLHLIQNILLSNHIPPQYLYLVANEYSHDKHSLTEIRDGLLDLLGDVFFVVPALITARYHREGATEEEKLLSLGCEEENLTPVSALPFRNPNGDDLPLWPAYNLTEQYLQPDLNMSLGQRLKEPRVEFWTSTIPLILSASDTLRSPLSSLIFLSLLQPFFLSCVPWEVIFL
uniref:Carboxylic ester hydrolase n=1 Tax=Macaca nemestrina TaxID=9545 RepID=A0A2K6BJD0_MACNE